MSSDLPTNMPDFAASADYRQWLTGLKQRFARVQFKAAAAVNTALLQFYWELGAEIVRQQAEQAWGSGFLNRLSADLIQAFPDVKGFSRRNLELIRQWHRYWNTEPVIAKQAVSQLVTIPWGHHLAEYALSDIRKPLGLSTYALSHALPEALRDTLPSIEAIEAELGKVFEEDHE